MGDKEIMPYYNNEAKIFYDRVVKRNNFFKGLERASEIVVSWPKWKQEVLGSSILR